MILRLRMRAWIESYRGMMMGRRWIRAWITSMVFWERSSIVKGSQNMAEPVLSCPVLVRLWILSSVWSEEEVMPEVIGKGGAASFAKSTS